MNRLLTCIGSGLLLLSALPLHAQEIDPGLPTTDYNGRQCYFYTVKGDESVFGIISRFGWDEEVFMEANPNAANMKKGEILYYPVETDAPASTPAEAVETSPLPQVGEIQVEEIKVEEISRVRPAMPGKEFTYTVKSGDTLYAIAREYNTTLARIFKANPGLTPDELAPGTQLRITPYPPGSDMVQTAVTEKIITGKRSYKATATDTWESIAAETKIPFSLLQKLNDTSVALKKGKRVNIPLLADSTYTAMRRKIDSREETPEGRTLIYNEVHGFPIASPLDVTILTGNSSENKNRDLEFVRGFLLALDRLKGQGYKIDLHVRTAEAAALSESAIAADPVLAKTDVIFTTFENFPPALAAFGSEKGKRVVNVFDAKDELYNSSPSLVHILTPSTEFYNACADYLLAAKPDAKYIFVAEDESDGECISLILLERLIRDGLSYETIPSYADLSDYSFTRGKDYVIVSDLSKRAEISKLLAEAERVNDRGEAHVSVLGRPAWVVYSEVLKEKLQKADTYIPSRFVMVADDPSVSEFEKSYTAAFKGSPVKSFPGYAAMGYDMGRYFLEQIKATGGDLNKAESSTDALQLDLFPERVTPWSGMLNRSVYLLHFDPTGNFSKIRLLCSPEK